MITTTTLKNAAFAIEHDLFTDPDGCNYLVKDGAILRRWEPEHSSADSFELAVALRMTLDVMPWGASAKRWSACDTGSTFHCDHEGIEEALLIARTAVLHCAAEIGAAL